MAKKTFGLGQVGLVLLVSLLAQVAITNAADYPTTVLAEPDLFAYWRFDDATSSAGSYATEEVNHAANYGIYNGSVTLEAGAPLEGVTGNTAANFAGGATNFVDVGPLIGFGSVYNYGSTIEMWVKATTGLDDGDQAPFGLYSDANSHFFLNLDENVEGDDPQDNHIRVFSRWHQGGADFDTGVTDGEWTYLAVAMNLAAEDENERLKIYIGDPIAKTLTEYTTTTPDALTPPVQTTNELDFASPAYIGAVNNDTVGPVIAFEGLIDEMALYTSMLDATTIQSHWEAAVGASPEPIPGDANHDQRVDGSDVTILAGNWQKGVSDGQTASWGDGDFNNDGKVDGSDVTILAGNWQFGVTAAASSVPEPSTLVILTTMAFAWLVYRRKK